MGYLKKVLKQTKLLKRFGILSITLAMIIGMLNDGILTKADDTVNANISFTSQIVEQINGSYIQTTDVQSGEPFFLAIRYTISANSQGSSYTNCILSITLPEHISFIGDTSDIQGTAFDDIEYKINFEGTSAEERVINIHASELVPGQTGTLYLKMNFDNMTTPDGTKADFRGMVLTGSVVMPDSSPNFNPVSVPSATVIATASQDWIVSKDVAKQNNQDYSIENIDGKQYYSVDYRLTVAPGSNIGDIGNSYGRLNCTYRDENGNKTDGFMLIDTLPVSPVANGGATQISVYAGSNKTNPLVEGQDYDLIYNDDGSVKYIRIKYASTYGDIKNDYTTAYVPDDAYVLTTYTINAKYSYDAYRVLPANEDKIPYLLDNKAEINYLPLGESTYKKSQDNASVQVGWVDEDAPVTDITINKYLTINGGEDLDLDSKFIFDQDKQDLYYQNTDSRIRFGLYLDQACQEPAVDFEGNTVGNMTELNEAGQVIFKNINEGTYYLKEDVGNLPFVGDGVETTNGQTVYQLEVKNENNGAVVYLRGKEVSNGQLDINNVNTDNGFGYVAFNKVGTSATSSTSGPLEGVKFLLINQEDPSLVYETYSNENGLVLFEAIPAGKYLVQEDFSSGEYDQPATIQWNVEVKANHINYPSGMSLDDDGMPYVINSSSKGKLMIKKVDQLDPSKQLDGAKFMVYGPFDSENDANIAINSNTLGAGFELSGNEESSALNKGYYVYQEITAPEGYKIDNNYYVTEVKTQTLNQVAVENEQLGKLRILKKGKLANTGVNIEVNLPGASFYLYTDENASDASIVKDSSGNPIVIQSQESISSEYNSNVVSLPAGTYYLKEFAAPEGYQLSTDIIKVTIESGKTTTQKIVNETDRYGYIQVEKVDSKAIQDPDDPSQTINKPISGVSFEIYNDHDQLIETITTNILGIAQSSFLPAGNYYLVEKDSDSLNDYVVNTDKIYVTVTNNQRTNELVKNDHLVNYKFQKVNSLTDSPLSNAQFTLYASDQQTVLAKEVTSDANGYVTFTNLIPGATYYYQETKAPDNFTLNSAMIAFTAPTIAQTDSNYTYEGNKVTNEPQGRFTVIKTQLELDQSQAVYASKQFAYFPVLSENMENDRQLAVANNTYYTLTTNKDTGTGTSIYLDAGTYWVIELNVSDPWTVQGGNNHQITVAPGNDGLNTAKINIVNELTKGKVAIKKVSSTDQNTSISATFSIYKKVNEANHDYSNDTIVATLTTSNEGGEAVSEWLDPGDYVLVETRVSGDYVLDTTPREFTIEAGKTNKVYSNTPLTNIPESTIGLEKVAIWKDDNGNVEEPLAGINFNVYQAVEVSKDSTGAVALDDKYYHKTGNVVTQITSDNKVTYSQKLEPGYYYIEEALTSEQSQDYQAASPQVVKLEAGQTTTVKFENIPLKGKIKVTKVSSVDPGEKLNGAVFEIYYVTDKTGDGIETIKASDGKTYNVEYSGISVDITSGTATLIKDDGTEQKLDGIGYSVLLEEGKEVVLKEVEAPQYYFAANTWYYVGMINKQQISEITITNIPEVHVVGDKYDEAKNRVEGAIMGLFSSSDGANDFNNLSDTEKSAVVNDQTKWATYDLLQTTVTSKESGFHFSDIDTTKTYYVLELVAPEGYNRNDKIYEVTVDTSKRINNDNKLENVTQITPGDAYYLIDTETGETLSITNYHYKQIWVKKVLDFAGDKTNLDGIRFKLYSTTIVDKDTPDAIKVMGADGDEAIYVVKDSELAIYETGTINEGKDNGAFITKTLPAGIYIIEEIDSGNSPEYNLPDYITKPSTTIYAVNLLTDSDNKDLYSENVDADNVIVNTTDNGKLALTKVSSVNSNQYLQATFNVFKQGVDYSNPANVITTITTNANGIPVLSDFLKAGKYVLIETSVESGYVLNQTPIEFTIEANKVTGVSGTRYASIDDARDNPLVVENVPMGNIKNITKTGTFIDKNGIEQTTNLAGVSFEVYHYQISNGQLVLDDTTKLNVSALSDNDGKIHFYQNSQDITDTMWLEPGNYILKETSVGNNSANGYVSNSYLGKFTIVQGQTTVALVEVNEQGQAVANSVAAINNKSTYGRLKLTKVDYYNQNIKLDGVVFEIFDANKNKVDEITTDASGIAISKLLPAGNYQVKEKTTKDGYFLNGTGYSFVVKPLELTTTSQDGQSEITNIKQQSIKIKKIDSETKEVITNLTNAHFTLWDQETGGNQVGEVICNEETKEIVFNGLQPDTKYYLQEETAPNGYKITNSNRIEITTTNNKQGQTELEFELENEPLGSIKIEKVSNWKIYDSTNTTNYPLAGVEFTLYLDTNNNQRYDENIDTIVTQPLTTDENGIVIFDNLEAGNYLVVESDVPENYTIDNTYYPVTVTKGKQNTTYTGNQAIVNVTNKGRFSFTKTDPDGNPLSGAGFQLWKQDSDGNYVTVASPFVVDNEDGYFLSDLLDPGNYRLEEIQAPEHFEAAAAIDFSIEAGSETVVTSDKQNTLVNQALGTVTITKYDDRSDYLTVKNEVLSGVEFGLYDLSDNLVASQITDKNGQIIFEDVAPGDYYVQEIKTLDGYQLDTTKYPVTIAANQSRVINYLPEVADGNDGEIINHSNAGRIVIKKQDDQGNGLAGAIFMITSSSNGFVPVEITTDENGLAVSDLLPASTTGRVYQVREIKAPDGYTLDEAYYDISKEMTVYPLQDQELIISNDNVDKYNYVEFTNQAINKIMDVDPQIKKYIIDGDKLIQDKSVNTPLLKDSDNERLAIRDYADGGNDVAVKKVVVEDTTMQLYYVDENNEYVPITLNDSYRINSVTIYHANDSKNHQIKAQVYYRNDENSNWQTNDQLLVNVPDANQNIQVSLENVMATEIKVEYFVENDLIATNFTADGIDLDVTINQRPSNATVHEIRRFSNTAKVVYEYSYKDENGTVQEAKLERNSNQINVYYPLNQTNLPSVSLGIVSGENNVVYRPGDTIESTITVINQSTDRQDSDLTIIQPIISFDLPLGMTLNTNSYTIDDYSGMTTNFQVVVYDSQDASDGMVLDPSQYDVVYNNVEARIPENNQLVGTGQQTRKVTISLADDFEFKPGMKITVKYMGTTSINDTSTRLYAPAYFASGQITELSLENPYGNAFIVESSSGSNYNTLVSDSTLDIIAGKDQVDMTSTGLKYPNSNGIIVINETNYLSIYKQVKGIYNDEYLNYNQIASTAPGEDLDYQIIFKNGGENEGESDRAISKARVVDILPFTGDSLVNRTDDNYTERSTSLDKAPVLNYVEVLDAVNVPYTLYYCVGSDYDSKFDEWNETNRTKFTASEELPIVYNSSWSDDDWTSGAHHWIKASEYTGDLNLVSAFAIEFDFSNDLLEPGETVTIHVKMTAPEYGTDEIDQVTDRLMSNSALIAVQRDGTDEISPTDITENREVRAQLTLPKGTIGDYVWYDLNRNGLQDDTDIPVQGLKVTLHKYVTTYDEDGKLQRQEIFSDDGMVTMSDEYGYYQFTNQDCNVLKAGKTDSSSTDPHDYVGDRYFEYRVEFAIPEDESTYTYVPTTRYATDDQGNSQTERDSNIGNDPTKVGDQAEDNDEYCYSEYFTLTATRLGDASLVGETNLTLDAGFVAKGSLGDYVWFDANKNGIQEDEESGVPGVVVRLYQVTENGEFNSALPLATTTTDSNGYYLFEDLVEGNYIVEFDIDGVVPTYGSGYLNRYYFTQANAGVDSAYDSNPIVENSTDTKAKTAVIHLDYHASDMSIDAGLTVYSALSGLVFEDRDYSDVQNYFDQDGKEIDTVLPAGTIVSLYQVDAEFDSINMIPDESSLIATTTIDENGNYLFDLLDAGYYVVKFTMPEGYSICSGDSGSDDTIDSDVANQIETIDNRVSGYTNVIEIGLNEHVEHVDGGARLYSALGDYVFEDLNSNGIQDEDDRPIPNTTVYLFRRDDNSSSWQYYQQTITDENGLYHFSDLEGSTYTGIQYRVIFDLKMTTKITITYAGDDIALDSNALNQYVSGFGYPTDPIDLPYNTTDLTIDAGIVQSLGAIGDYVWYDSNVNGLQDEEGTGIGNIKVILEANNGDVTNEDDWEEVGTTYTNSQGYYIFNNLKPGYYRVKFEVPSQYYVTLSTQGEDSAIDSDGIYSNDNIYYYTRSFYLEQDGYDMTWDLGVYDPTITTSETSITNTYFDGGILTGDNINSLCYLLLAAGSASIFTYGYRKRRKTSKSS